MARVLKIILILSVTILPLFLYMGWSLGSIYGWILLVLLFTLILTFPFVRLKLPLIHLTFLSMGFLTYLMMFVLIKDIMGLMHFSLPVAWTYLLAGLAVLLGTYIAYRGPKVVKLRLPLPTLPPELNGLRIVQISDLHVGPTIGKKYVEAIVRKANALDADLIALTGDIGDGPVERYREAIDPLKNLKSNYGVFYVPGNHEYYWNANEWMSVLNNLGAIVLVNRGKIISIKGQEVLMGGVSDPAGLAPDPQTVAMAGSQTGLKILLSHRPGIAQRASELGFHLQLSGHTHGGQFFPWTIVVRFVHKHFLGHHLVNKMWLNVNAGTGSWGPFLRLGTTSEMTQIELFSSNKSLE